MTIPHLPFIHDAQGRPSFLIDNSGLELLKCPKLFLLQFLRRRCLATSRAGRNFGSGAHVGWAERFLRGVGPVTDAEFTEICEKMREWFFNNPQPLEDFRNWDHACTVMREYLRQYPTEQFKILSGTDGKPIVEASFALPLGVVDYQGVPIQILYSGKLDLGIEDNTGVWVLDHKTAFMFGDTWDKQMQRDAGQRGYVWALTKVLPPGTKVNGYIIDGVRIRRPNPRKDNYTESGAPVDKSDFRRIPYYVSPQDLLKWQANTLAKVKEVFYFHAQGYFPEHEWNCTNKFGPCDMYDVCSLPGEESQENMLASTGYEENTWTLGLKVQEKQEHNNKEQTKQEQEKSQ